MGCIGFDALLRLTHPTLDFELNFELDFGALGFVGLGALFCGDCL